MPKILIVDDSRLIQAEVGTELRMSGYETIIANTGREALTILKKEKVDAILLDLEMPELEGIPTLEEIRKNPKMTNIPVIVCTAHGYVDNAEDSVRLGAHFLTKPVDFARLKSKLKNLLGS